MVANSNALKGVTLDFNIPSSNELFSFAIESLNSVGFNASNWDSCAKLTTNVDFSTFKLDCILESSSGLDLDKLDSDWWVKGQFDRG